MVRPLWQLLMDFDHANTTRELSCDECFTILEYYADQLASSPDPDTLQPSIKQHLARCLNCQSKFAAWISRLENL